MRPGFDSRIRYKPVPVGTGFLFSRKLENCLNDSFYMKRALHLARNGEGFVSPNPMVGAVIVAPEGKIIGEGWHRKFGEAHAEVNACLAVSEENEKLLHESTIYVTLEPCSHYGKTPPCADLLVRKRFKRVVIGLKDPFSEVDGHGIQRLREAGIEVTVGVMEKECRELNKVFLTAHTLHRPYIILKWAQSADGWMDSHSRHPFKFSTPLTQTLVHQLRANCDAIITSTKTVKADNPLLDIRYWPHGRRPKTFVANRNNFKEILRNIYEDHHFISVLIEAGPTMLTSILSEGLWDEARVEVNPVELGKDGMAKAPAVLPAPFDAEKIDGNTIYRYLNLK